MGKEMRACCRERVPGMRGRSASCAVSTAGSALGRSQHLGISLVLAIAGTLAALAIARLVGSTLTADVGVGLLTGGALANLVDRGANGSVTDLLLIGTNRGTVFKIADIAFLIGAALTTRAMRHCPQAARL